MSKDHDKAPRDPQYTGRHKIDHQIRNEWVHKDAGLAAAWRSSGMTRDDFIRHNEAMIDKVIVAHLDEDR